MKDKKQKKLLIVGDHVLSKVVRFFPKHFPSLKIVETDNYLKALKILENEKFDILLTELFLPAVKENAYTGEIDRRGGEKLIKQAKNKEILPKILFVIGCSCCTPKNKSVIEKRISVEINEYFRIVFSVIELSDTLAKYI